MMKNPQKKTILVTGATGAQGGAVARALLEEKHTVRAATRNSQTESARSLAELGAEVVEADFDNPGSLTEAARGTDATFVMGTPFESGPLTEVRQAISAIEATLSAGTDHIVYSSVASALEDTGVQDFGSKAEVERYLVNRGVSYTVIAPTAFLSQPNDPFLWAGAGSPHWPGLDQGYYAFALPADVPLQMIVLADLAKFAALVFSDPQRFASQRIQLASFSVTGTEIASHLSRTLERPIKYREVPSQYWRDIAGEDGVRMVEFFIDSGYKADIDTLHANHPEVPWTSLATWAASHDWNGVELAPGSQSVDSSDPR